MMTLYDNENEECRHILHWHYYHGQTETFMNHDIVCMKVSWKPEFGKTKVSIVSPDGNQTKEAICYSWMTDCEHPHQRGLIVFENDQESVVYAERVMKEKAPIL